MPQKIIIDTDPGVDDAMAILFAFQSPELEVIGLTTVFGNVEVPLATENALKLVEFAEKPEVVVAQGAEGPLVGEFEGAADFVHGADGFGDVGLLPNPTLRAADASAAEWIVEQVMANPGEITLVPIGPLTNIALALELEPKIAENAEVVLMGGAATVHGNMNPAAEANIYNDPHAADRVFTAGWPLTMVGLDVTTEILMEEAYLESLRSSTMGDFIFQISRFYQLFHEKYHGLSGLHTHDPAAIAYLIDPTLFTVEAGPVRVATDGVTKGHTLFDRHQDWIDPNEWSTQKPVNVCIEADAERLRDLFKARICGNSEAD